MTNQRRHNDDTPEAGIPVFGTAGAGSASTVELFAATVVWFRTPSGWMQVTPGERRTGPRALDETCHVISSIYSHDVDGSSEVRVIGDVVPEDVAARRHGDLVAELGRRGTWVGDALGCAPDLSYGEVSVVVGGLDRTEAVDIGRRFGQVAIFEIDPDAIRVVGCLVPGVLSERPYHLTLSERPPDPGPGWPGVGG